MSKIVYRGKSDDKPEKPTNEKPKATAEKPAKAEKPAGTSAAASKSTAKVTAKATPVKKTAASSTDKPAAKTVTAKASPVKKAAASSTDKPAAKTVTAKAAPRRKEAEVAAEEKPDEKLAEKPVEKKPAVKAQATIKQAKPKKQKPNDEPAEVVASVDEDAEDAAEIAATTAAVQDDDEIAEGNVSTQREGVGLTDTLLTKEEGGEDGDGDVADEKIGYSKEKIIKYFKRHPKLKINTKVDRFEPELEQGLNAEQVETRFKQYLFNDTNKQYSKSYLSIFLGNIFTFFNLLCIIAAICLGIAGVSSITSYLVILILALNVTIGIIQEIRSKIAVDKLSILATSATKVIRDGETVEIPTKEVVLDDIIIMELGNQVPADCTLADGSVEVNESLLTGESVAIKKQVGDVLYAGSFISSGNGKCRVDKVGKETYLEKLSEKAKKYKSPNSELMKSIRMFIKVISIIIIPVAIGVFFVTRSQDAIPGVTVIEEWLGIAMHDRQALAKTCTVVIGMIPSGLMLLTSVALAVGVVRLAKNNTLVRELYSLEMLARVNVLCLDKTGTITDGRMKVNDAVILNTVGEYSLNEIMGSMNAALDDNNQTSIALFNHFGHSDKLAPVTKIPFSSKRKLSAVTFADVGTFVLGAPEFVLKPMPLKVERIVKQYAQMGLRVVVLAHSSTSIMSGDKLPAVLKPIAIISIADNIREDAIETIKWFKENDVQVKVISGDNPITVSEVAKRAGIDHADKFISLDGLNDKEVENVANKYTVFGRVTPEQKAILVRAIKTEGNTVAMTGDGVNDILALKEADCAISVASGSEAARNVSHLVLMDNNFANMPKVVGEGRRVINNIKNSASLYIMKTLFTAILAALCIALPKVFQYPFMTQHMLLLEMFVIGVPSFFLSLQPNNARVEGKFIPHVMSRSVPGAIIMILNVIAMYLVCYYDTSFSTYTTALCTIALTCSGLVMLYRICQPLNWFRVILFAAMAAVSITVICVPTLTHLIMNDKNWDNATWDYAKILIIVVAIEASFPLSSWLIKIMQIIMPSSTDKKKPEEKKKEKRAR